MVTFEFRLPIRPEPSFYSNVKLATLSLAKVGGAYTAAPMAVWFGGGVDPARVRADNRWANAFPNVQWRPAPPLHVHPEFASGMARYGTPATADVVILMDADACLLRPIDDLLKVLASAPGPMVAAVPAHGSPFSSDGAENDNSWQVLLADFGFRDVPLDGRYYWSPKGYPGACPGTYFNYGFVAFNRLAFDRVRALIAPTSERLLARYAGTQTAFFSAQMALALSLLKKNAAYITLSHAFNCPNSDEMDSFAPLCQEHIRVLHYLRQAEVDRHRFLCVPEAFEAFCGGTFASPAMREFQRHVRSLRGVFYGTGE